MLEFFLADVRKRTNPDFNTLPQPIPERRAFSDEADGAAVKDYRASAALFAAVRDEIPDDPAACPLAGADGVTMEWTAGPSFGQIDFYSSASGQDEPKRFLSLCIFSGALAAEDRAAMRQFEQYADFSRCLNFPLVLQVTDDPLSAAWEHQALQGLRQGVTPLVAAFLHAYFPAEEASSH